VGEGVQSEIWKIVEKKVCIGSRKKMKMRGEKRGGMISN